MEHNDSAKRAALCQQCQSFDIDKFLATATVTTYRPPQSNRIWAVPLSELQDFSKFPNCPLCSLFKSVAHARKGTRRSKEHRLIAVDSFEATGVKHSRKRPRPTPRTFLSVYPGLPSEDFINWTPPISGYRGFITSSTSKNANLARVDYSILRKCIQKCGRLHKVTCLAKSSLPGNLRVIDCYEKTLVPLQSSDYVALSYVWGFPKSEHEIVHQPKLDATDRRLTVISQRLPLTILDAMAVVRNLGYRYLWVDRYSIDQDDNDDKRLQIGMMDRIFENAVVTIVALSGKDCEAGLPGVSSVPRSAQPSAVVGDQHLVSTLPHVAYFIERSTWSTRGWTYQEAMLSRRCLFFTDVQTYFLCRSMYCSETVPDSMEFTANTLPDPLLSLSPAILSLSQYEGDHTKNGTRVLVPIMLHVAEYTKRSLTYESDAIDAFKGILSRYVPKAVFGIPVFASDDSKCSNSNIGFLLGLLWSRRKLDTGRDTVSRRKDFPTWSWASIDAPIGYDLIQSQPFLFPSNQISPRYLEAIARMDVKDESGALKPVHHALQAVPHLDELPMFQTLYIEADILSIESVRHPYDGASPRILHRDVCANPRVLIIHFVGRREDEDHGRGFSGSFFVDEIVNGDDQHLSRLVSGAMPEQHWLAVALLRDPSRDIAFFHFLVVDWNGQTARRIGVGVVWEPKYDRIPKKRRRFPLV